MQTTPAKHIWSHITSPTPPPTPPPPHLISQYLSRKTAQAT